MRLRVASPPASSHPDRVAHPGHPFYAPFLLSRRPNPKVALWASVPSAVPAMEGSSFPELRMPSALLVSAGFRVTPVFTASSYSASNVGLELPLVLHLRLLPVMDHRVTSMFASSAVPICQYSSRLAYQPFGIADDSLCRFPRTSNPPAPTDGYPSYPGSHTHRFALVKSSSRPEHPSLATAIDQFPGCPKSWVFHRSPIYRASSFPEPWFSADPYLHSRVTPFPHLRLSR